MKDKEKISTDQEKGKSEELLRRAQKLNISLEENQKKINNKQKYSGAGQAQKHISDTIETYNQVTGTLFWIYSHIIRPLFTHPWVGIPLRLYASLWKKTVYTKDKQGDICFSKKRSGLLVIATLFFLWNLPFFLSGTIEFIWDTTSMAVSYKTEEIIYLGKSQEIDPAGNVFSAQGCEQIRCTDQTSIYFRIKPSLAHQLWSLFHYGNFFFPDYVSAGIQNDINKCKVTGYGSRWKFLVRNWEIYPQILSVDCVPVSEGEIEEFERLHPDSSIQTNL